LTERLPVVSGAHLIASGHAAGILRDAGLDRDELRRLL
jgi:hypothetical protein